jgi:GT2 family glycosyltransferase
MTPEPSGASPTDRPTLSIVIVNYNTRDATLECLASVFGTVDSRRTEVILVDNGSHDASAETIREQYPLVTVVEAGDNIGFARGVNLGARYASGDYVLLLNPDTVVRDGSLDAIVDFAEQHPEYGMYGGRTLRPSGDVDPSSCWGEPTVWSLASFALGLSTAFKGSAVFDPESLGDWQRDSVREVPVITGCLLLMRRADWERLGGMDESFFLYGEDAEFSIRARRSGLRPVIVPDAVIVHEVGGSTSNHGAKMCMVMAGKATLLDRTWSPGRARVGKGLLQLGALLRGTGETLRGREPSWATVWKRRRDWRDGYPRAEVALFGHSIRSGVIA